MKTLEDRKHRILEAIIQDYVHAAEPVGSRHLSRKYRLGVSPATIRNEMADLEDEGYIIQPHTSAGRIPTDKGYRYYVDNIMRTGSLTQKEELMISRSYRASRLDVERAIENILSAASNLTSYAAVMMVENNSGRHRIFYHGITNMASQPEFSDAPHLKNILKVFEEQDLLCSILKDYSAGTEVTIKIGSENKFKEVRECSVVVSPCETEGGEIAAMGLIGPTRMFYDKASSVINYVSAQFNDILERMRA
jgi:transcriptional regulator of heat shock response